MRKMEERIHILEEDLESEQHLRRRVEREKQELQMQIISLSERVTEAEGGTENQLVLCCLHYFLVNFLFTFHNELKRGKKCFSVQNCIFDSLKLFSGAKIDFLPFLKMQIMFFCTFEIALFF